MTNFDPKKLEAFLNENKGLTSEEVARQLAEKNAPKKEEAPITADVPKAYFPTGEIITVSSPDGKTENYRVLGNNNGTVTIMSIDSREKGEEKFLEEDLKKIATVEEEKKKVSLKPLSDFFNTFNLKSGYDADDLIAWKSKWVDSGNIDAFRKNYSNIKISDELLADARKALDFYIEALSVDLPGDLNRAAVSGAGTCARILTGVHDPEANDIEYLVNHNILLSGPHLDRLRDAVEKAKNPPAATSAPATPAHAPVHTDRLRAEVGWPFSSVRTRRKGKESQHTEWIEVAKDGKEYTLPHQEAWQRLSESFKEVFNKDYLDFISNIETEELHLIQPVIDAKKRVTDAIKDGDLDTAGPGLERFKKELEKWKKIWGTLQEIRRAKEYVESYTKREEKIASYLDNDQKESLKGRREAAESSVSQADEILKGKDLSNDEKEKLATLITEYEKAVEFHEESTKSQRELRPKVSERQKVILRTGEKISTAEWQRRQDARSAQKNEEGRVQKNETYNELLAKHKEMYERNPEEYLNTYAVRVVVPTTDTEPGRSGYRSKRYIQREQTTKNAVTKTLLDKGIYLDDPDLSGGTDLPGGPENNDMSAKTLRPSLLKHRMTYSPSAERYQKARKGASLTQRDPRTEAQKLQETAPVVHVPGNLTQKTPYGAGLITPDMTPTNAQAIQNPPHSPEPTPDQAPQADRRPILAKIEKLLNLRTSRLEKLGWAALAAAVVVGSVVYQSQKLKNGKVDAPTTPPVASAPEAIKTLNSTDWKNYMDLHVELPDKTWKRTPEGEISLNIEESLPQTVIEKNVPSYVRKGDFSAGDKLLAMKIGPILDGNLKNHFALNPEQRAEMSRVLVTAEKMEQALIKAGMEKIKRGDKNFSLPVFNKTTIGTYLTSLGEAARSVKL